MKNLHNKSNVKGFTLIEMIIVIAIIAILATIVTISVSSFRRDSLIERANENAKIVGQGIQDWLTTLELDGVQIAKSNPNGVTGKYMTITSNRGDMLFTDVGYKYTLDGVERVSVDTAAEKDLALNTILVKDYEPGTSYSDNSDDVGNGLFPNRLTGMVLADGVERNLSMYIGNDEMEAMKHTWLCVVDTESNTVLYTLWLDEVRVLGFTNNEQRWREWAGSTLPVTLNKYAQDVFYKNHGVATGCYPFVEDSDFS